MNNPTNRHSMEIPQLEAELGTNVATGLDAKEAARRVSKSGGNRVWRVKRASAGEAFLRVLLDLSTLILIGVALIAAVFEKTTELFAILFIVALGGGARVALHIWTQRTFEEKARGVIPRTTVIRNSRSVIKSAENLAVGDVIVLFAGDTVPADARIVSTGGLLVYENRMTDNRSIVFKTADTIAEGETETPIEKRDNMLYAGSTVVSGEARAVVVATGGDTLAVAKFGTLTIPSGEKLKVSEKLTGWSRAVSIGSLGVVLLVTLIGAVVRGGSAVELLLSSAALAGATMCESLSVIGALAVASCVKRADTEDAGRAKVKNAASVEELNAVDTIVLEDPAMLKAGDVTLNAYFIGDRLINVDEPGRGVSASELLKYCYVTTGMLPQGTFAPSGPALPDETSVSDYAAIRKVFDEYFADSGESKAMANTVLVGHEAAYGAGSGGLDTSLICRDGNFEAAVSGPVELVLSCCTTIKKGGRVCQITREDLNRISEEVATLRRRGVYTVGVARRDSPYINMNRVSALQMCMTFEGFLAMSDRAYGDALDAVRKCREGKEIRMICFTEGSDEDRAFLESCGFLTESDRYLTLKEATENDALKLGDGVFAAVCTGSRDKAKTRRDIYRRLVKGGCRPVYVSRDPADMWLMKDAAVSFAVPTASKISKTIPQAARSSADVIATPESGGGVREAFRVTELSRGAGMNLRRCMNYLAASNVCRLVLLLVTSFMKSARPADPASFLLWGLIFDLAVAFAACLRTPPWNIASVKESAHTLQKSAKDFIFPAVAGFVWSMLLLSIPAALSSIPSVNISDGAASNVILVSALLSIPVVGGEMMTNGSLFKFSGKRGRSIPLLMLLGLVTSLIFAFSKTASGAFGGETLSFKYYLLSFIPAALCLAALEIYKAASARRSRRSAEKEEKDNKQDNKQKGES